MALFIGTHENKIDRKGRVSLPADYRAELPSEDDRTIYIFPMLCLNLIQNSPSNVAELKPKRYKLVDNF